MFLLLSIHDANPLVVFEALAAGLPIVCTERAGNAIDFIEDGKNGFIVDPLNEAQIVEKVLAVLNSPDPAALRAHSRQKVSHVNYENSARAFIDAIRGVSPVEPAAATESRLPPSAGGALAGGRQNWSE